MVRIVEVTDQEVKDCLEALSDARTSLITNINYIKSAEIRQNIADAINIIGQAQSDIVHGKEQ